MTADSGNPDPHFVLIGALQTGTLLVAALAQNSRLIAALSTALEGTIQQGLKSAPEPLEPSAEHRRAHRPGVLSRIDTDPELQAFIRARIDRLTFPELATEVASHFPEHRRVGRSAIHDWWQKHRPPR